ncbi:hypothetical protein ABIB25_003556 [Nakamurella sp. UYEF19]|uniref:glycosyltransferase family 1 protein n=1 Tax=Nakamurella sp. UYEF19 TaxID=1756392 RepID=UPI003398C3D4
MNSGIIRVASVPSGHPYVENLGDPDGGGGVVRPPDPRPAVAVVAPGQWWPPRMLDLDWLADHHDEFDVMHLHFGFDAATPTHLADWTGLLAQHRIPLVLTVHDLINPHFADPTGHQVQLDVLIPAAADLITLTPQAASVIRRRWGAAATVIPHPHLVPLPRMDRPRPAHGPFVVGIHAKSLRANIDPVPLLTELLPALPSLPRVVLRVDVHPEILELDGSDQRGPGSDQRGPRLREWLEIASNHPQVSIEVHDRFDDDQLWDYLQAIDLCVLPYRFGTHSGWLEACVDLGTGVLVPATGCYEGQHGHPIYGPGAAGLVDMIKAVVAQPALATPIRPDRFRQRQQIARAHEEVYRRVLRLGSRSAQKPSVKRSEVSSA